MRRIPASGGLEFGPSEGPWIDVIPHPTAVMRPSPETLLREVEDGLPAAHWMRLTRRLSPTLPRGFVGVAAVAQAGMIRFAHPKAMKPLDALYEIERVEGGALPPGILASVYFAQRGLDNNARADMLAAALHVGLALMRSSGRGAERSGYSRLSSRDINALAERLTAHPTLDVQMPTGVVDRARYWLALSRMLWREDVMRRMASADFGSVRYATEMGPALLMLASVSTLHPALSGRGRMRVRGVELAFPQDSALVLAWPQALEWMAGNISTEALRWLSKGQFPASGPKVDDMTIRGDIDVARANAAAEALLEEAKAHAVYVPSGQFRLRLPADTPLAPWGVKYLRVWAEPERLWVQFVGKGQDALGTSVEWRPVHPTMMRPYVISQATGAMDAAHVTLAALWHDLVTAAEAALPEEGREPGQEAVRQAQAREQGRREGQGRGRSYRKIPRQRVRLRGRRDWSTEAERQRIMRRHRVSGHLRQLPAGWSASQEAQRWAKRYGFIVPRGYTFVRPHMRGSDEREVETVVVARGLETLMLLK